jgi:hypothetical protein
VRPAAHVPQAAGPACHLAKQTAVIAYETLGIQKTIELFAAHEKNLPIDRSAMAEDVVSVALKTLMAAPDGQSALFNTETLQATLNHLFVKLYTSAWDALSYGQPQIFSEIVYTTFVAYTACSGEQWSGAEAPEDPALAQKEAKDAAKAEAEKCVLLPIEACGTDDVKQNIALAKKIIKSVSESAQKDVEAPSDSADGYIDAVYKLHSMGDLTAVEEGLRYPTAPVMACIHELISAA